MTLDTVLVWVNAAGAALAVGVNLYEARHGFSEWRILRYTIAAVASFYVVGYTILGLGLVDRLAWSKFFVGVAPAAWLIVWCGPALRSAQVRRLIRKGARG